MFLGFYNAIPRDAETDVVGFYILFTSSLTARLLILGETAAVGGARLSLTAFLRCTAAVGGARLSANAA